MHLTLPGLTELRLSVPETGKRLLPLPIAAWHATVGARALEAIAKGDHVLVHGQLVRRFYRSGAGARSLTEVVASDIKKLDPPEEPPESDPARGCAQCLLLCRDCACSAPEPPYVTHLPDA